LGIAERAPGHRVVEDEAGAADQVAMAGVVHRAVVLVVVEEAAGRVDAARVVEGHRVGDVRAQEGGRTEIGSVHAVASCWLSSRCTSSSVGIAAKAPLRVTASAPTAAATRRVSLIATGSWQKAAKAAPVPPRSASPHSTPPTKASPAAVVSATGTRKLGTSPLASRVCQR